MATYKHIRSSTANKRPTTAIADGQIAINTNTASPGLFFKDSAGTGIVKVGPVHVGTSAPNASPAAGGSTGNYTGEQWLDTSLTPAQLKVWNGSAWVGVVADELPVSKLQDGQARQLLQTDAAGTGVEWTSNVDVPGTLDVTGATTLDSTLTVPLGSAASPTLRFSGDANTGVYSPGADQLALSTNGTGRLFVDASGRVGIGTYSPAWNLHVASDANTFQTITSSTTTDAGLLLGDTDSTARGQIRYANTIDSMLLYTAGSEKLRITSAGLVGIGTSSPSTSLALTTATTTALAGFESFAEFNKSGASTTDQGGGIVFSQGGNRRAAIGGFAQSGGTDGYLSLWTRPSSGNVEERLRITNTGNVGIGTTSPGSYLEVAHAGAATANLRSVTFANGITDNNFKLAAWTGVSTGASGDIMGSLGLSYTTTKNSFINFHRGGSTTGGFMSFAVNNDSEAVRIDNSGRLLVGTSSAYAVAGFGANDIQVFNQAGIASIACVATSNTSNGAQLCLGKSRGGTSTIVQDGDTLGQLRFGGADGTDVNTTGAQIAAVVDGTPGLNDMPCTLIFSTTSDGAANPTPRMRIKTTGTINFSNVATYADNTAALAGGLVTGDVYRKSDGTLMITY